MQRSLIISTHVYDQSERTANNLFFTQQTSKQIYRQIRKLCTNSPFYIRLTTLNVKCEFVRSDLISSFQATLLLARLLQLVIPIVKRFSYTWSVHLALPLFTESSLSIRPRCPSQYIRSIIIHRTTSISPNWFVELSNWCVRDPRSYQDYVYLYANVCRTILQYFI